MSVVEAQRLLPQFKATVQAGDVAKAKEQLVALKVGGAKPSRIQGPRQSTLTSPPNLRVCAAAAHLASLSPPPPPQILMTTFPAQSSAQASSAPSAEEVAVARESLPRPRPARDELRAFARPLPRRGLASTVRPRLQVFNDLHSRLVHSAYADASGGRC
jgi:hypothetical protein